MRKRLRPMTPQTLLTMLLATRVVPEGTLPTTMPNAPKPVGFSCVTPLILFPVTVALVTSPLVNAVLLTRDNA